MEGAFRGRLSVNERALGVGGGGFWGGGGGGREGPGSDGFFFTIGRKGYTGDELLDRLLYYGVSAISLRTTGSEQQGIRVCTSMVKEAHYAFLDERLEIFNRMEK